jgi:uncharacterized protein YciI
VKYVTTYESADNVKEKAPLHVAAHREWWKGFAESGDLLGLGPFADSQADGSMAIFRSRESAEAFVAGDPFVLNGVVKAWRILEWNDVVAP